MVLLRKRVKLTLSISPSSSWADFSALAAKPMFFRTSVLVFAFSKASRWNSIVERVPSIWLSWASYLERGGGGVMRCDAVWWGVMRCDGVWWGVVRCDRVYWGVIGAGVMGCDGVWWGLMGCDGVWWGGRVWWGWWGVMRCDGVWWGVMGCDEVWWRWWGVMGCDEVW